MADADGVGEALLDDHLQINLKKSGNGKVRFCTSTLEIPAVLVILLSSNMAKTIFCNVPSFMLQNMLEVYYSLRDCEM